MHVVVGSGNPVKRRATEAALAGAAGDGDGSAEAPVTVTARAVASGVAEQPRGHAETRRGAINRARAARSVAGPDAGTGAVDFGVGLEGGVAQGVDHERDRGPDGDADSVWEGTVDDVGPFLVMWAAVTDGDRLGVGAGPSVPLPDRVATRVDAGEELGPVMDDLLGTDGVARGRGAVGAFTDGLVDREGALAVAVAAAFAPFRSSLY
jgi:inosine/xanthosine triphosphatase